MKTMINRIQLSILVISLASTVTMAQIPRDSMKVDTTKMQKVATKIDSTKAKVVAKTDTTKSKMAMKFDSTKVKVAAKIDTVKKDVKVAVDKAIDKVTPDKPTEVAQINTPKSSVTLTADPTTNAVFHKGSLVIGAGFVYQKDLLPLMLVGEYGIGKNIGVELRGWYGSKTSDGVKFRDGLFGVGLNYHFTGKMASSSSKFDTYLGALYGKILDETGSALYAQAGARYFFIQRLGVFGNFNIGLIGSRGTNLSVGLAYSLFR
jgi:hypothetical protein